MVSMFLRVVKLVKQLSDKLNTNKTSSNFYLTYLTLYFYLTTLTIFIGKAIGNLIPTNSPTCKGWITSLPYMKWVDYVRGRKISSHTQTGVKAVCDIW